jgi:N-methylhydantoinase B/oxoprolinase/acetone carboxylase alpha subunit
MKPMIKDPVMLMIFSNYLTTVAREMGVAMMETAYSSVFNEAQDFSCGLFDRNTDMLSQAEFCPSMMGSIHFAARWIVDEYGLQSFGPNDVYLHNDPYRGMCHLPEHMVIKAVYYGDEIVGLVGCIGHMTEVGGRAPGGFPGDVTDIFQEGLRIPPTKLIKDGQEVKEVWNIIAANVRTPRANIGDLKAMIGSLYIGESRIVDLIDKYGLSTYQEMCVELKDYQERRMRELIRSIPNGVYESEEYVMDNDGISNDPVKVKVKVTVCDEQVEVDFAGSDPQRDGPINCTFAATASAVYNAILQISDLNISANAGCYRPISIKAPLGTVVNVAYPGACVGGNSEMHAKLVFLLLRALAKAIPEKVAAPDIGTSALISYGGHNIETDEFYSNLLIESGGWGGRNSGDGNDAVTVPNSNCRITPIEVLETRYPLRHLKFTLHEGSGGAGKCRGGLGTNREIELLNSKTRVSAFVEREKLKPWGLFGGKEGSNSGFFVKRKGEAEYRTFSEAFGTICNGKFSDRYLSEGDCIRVVTGGGGGYGPPEERGIEAIRNDLDEGYFSEADLCRDYPHFRRMKDKG